MNPSRTIFIESLIGLGALLILVTVLGLYMLNEPARIEAAQFNVLTLQLDEGMTLYAENCAVCHGLNGEGIGAIPPLNTPGLQGMAFEDLNKIIARGRFDTAMPAWSKEDGGPLSEYQISELTAVIQSGDWKAVGDRVVNLGLAPLIPFSAEPDPMLLESVGNLADGAILQSAIQIFASNCVACHGADGLGTTIAPPINDPLVREKTAEEITRTITYGNAGTLMAGWSKVLSVDEIHAMVVLIQRWDEIPAGSIPAPEVSIPTTTESIARGEELFASNCSSCHGPEGQGTRRAPSLNVKSFLTNTSDQAIQQIITLGVSGTAMPAWGDRISAADIQAIVGFLRQWEATAPEVAEPLARGGGGPPWLRNQAPTPAAAPTSVSTALPNTPQPDGATEQVLPTATTTVAQPTHAQPAGEGFNPAGQGRNQNETTSSSPSTAIDWRVLVLLGASLAAAITLILTGYTALKNLERS